MIGPSVRQYGLLATFVVGSVAVALLSAPVQAEWVSDFCGYTVMSDDENADGIVNFAVWKPAAGDTDWTDDFGSGFDAAVTELSGTVDTDVTFVIFYQIVNTNVKGASDDLDTFSIDLTLHNYVTSYGYVEDHGFRDASGSAGNIDADNPVLGAEPSSYSDDELDGIPSGRGAGREPLRDEFNVLDAGEKPGKATLTATELKFEWTGIGINAIGNDGHSTILWVTTDAPGLGYTEGSVGKSSSDGDVPYATPEPSSLALLALAMLGAAVSAVWRRRRSTQQLMADSKKLSCTA